MNEGDAPRGDSPTPAEKDILVSIIMIFCNTVLISKIPHKNRKISKKWRTKPSKSRVVKGVSQGNFGKPSFSSPLGRNSIVARNIGNIAKRTHELLKLLVRHSTENRKPKYISHVFVLLCFRYLWLF